MTPTNVQYWMVHLHISLILLERNLEYDLSVAINLQDYLLPEEYVKIMRASMLDKCPVSTYKQVCDVFLAQLGCLPNEVSQVKCGFSY